MAHYRIESNIRPFLDSILPWDDRVLSFNEAAFGAMAHAMMLGLGDSFVKELADEFECAPSTVCRWANGLAKPHPRLQKLIVSSLARRLEQAKERPPPKTPRSKPKPYHDDDDPHSFDPNDPHGGHTPDR